MAKYICGGCGARVSDWAGLLALPKIHEIETTEVQIILNRAFVVPRTAFCGNWIKYIKKDHPK